MAQLSKDWNTVVGSLMIVVGLASVAACYGLLKKEYLKPFGGGLGCTLGGLVVVWGVVTLLGYTLWTVSDGENMDFLYGEGADDLDDSGEIDMEAAGIEEVDAMRSGLSAKEAAVSGPGMSGQPGDYVPSGEIYGQSGAYAGLAPNSGMLGADIPEDELAAWSGLQNPGSSETMLISHQDMIGIDSIGQTKRNMTRDIRGEPVIQPAYTGPFGQSTISRGDLDNTYLTTPGISLPM